MIHVPFYPRDPGTPIYQITFIKREHWKAEAHSYDESLIKKQRNTYTKVLQNGFRRFFLGKETIRVIRNCSEPLRNY